MEKSIMEQSVLKKMLWVMVFFWMMIIFCFSAQPSDESAALSGGIVESIVNTVVSNFDYLTVLEQEAITDQWSFIVRKAAHGFVYAVLAVLSLQAIKISAEDMRPFKKIRKNSSQRILALLLCLIYAITDEVHQFFVPGRSCELRDVMVDFIGACLGLGIFILIQGMIKKFRQKNESRKTK